MIRMNGRKFLGLALICLLMFCAGCDSQKEEQGEESNDYGMIDYDYEYGDDMESNDDDRAFDEEGVEESIEQLYTYSLDDIYTLNGVFRLNENADTVTQVVGNLGSGNGVRIMEYDGNEGDDWLGWGAVPTDINRENGEKLVLVGTEWANMSQADKESGVIPMNHLNFLGYGNISMLSNMSRTEILDIQNIDISSVSEDEEAVNAALSGTGLRYHTYYVIQDSFRPKDLLLTDQYMQEVAVSYYEGTEYLTLNIAMADPCYLGARTVTEDTPTVSVQQTKEGYFILDVSGLPQGLYAVEGYSGSYVVNII